MLAADLARYAEPDRVFDLLRPPAWAQGAGLPRREIWAALANAMAGGSVRYRDDDLTRLLDTAGFYLVESGEFGQTVHRLYHQALVDHFRARSPHDAQTRITNALLDTLGPPSNRHWAAASPYIGLARRWSAHRTPGRDHLGEHALLELVLTANLDVGSPAMVTSPSCRATPCSRMLTSLPATGLSCWVCSSWPSRR